MPIEGNYNQGGEKQASFQARATAKEQQVLDLFSSSERKQGVIDPYTIDNKLFDYQDQVWAKIQGRTVTEKEGDTPKITYSRTPLQEEQAFLETIKHVRHAFEIDAFPHFPHDWQQAISEEVYEEESTHPPDEQFTLTDAEKHILQQLKALAGLPDDPTKLTYSFGSIPHIVESD